MNSTKTPKGQAPGGVKATPKQTVKPTSKPLTKSPVTTKLDADHILLGQDANAPRPTATPSTKTQASGKKTVLVPKTIPKDSEPAPLLGKRELELSSRRDPDTIKKMTKAVTISESPCVCTFQRTCPSHKNYHSLAALNLRKKDVRKLEDLDIWPANEDHELWTVYNPPPKKDAKKGAKRTSKTKAAPTQDLVDKKTAAPFKTKAVDHIIELHEVERAYYRAQEAWEQHYPAVKTAPRNEIEKKLIEIFNSRDNLCGVPTNFNGWKYQFLRLAGDDDVITQLKRSDSGTSAHLRPNDRAFIRLDRTILSLWMDTVKLNQDEPMVKKLPDISRPGIISGSLKAYYENRLDARMRILEQLSEAAATSKGYAEIYLWIIEALEEDKKRFDEMQARVEQDFLMLSQTLDKELNKNDEMALEKIIADREARGLDDDYESDWEEDV
ncbi:hypothetical protein OC846_004173 [Tilletia horrida]|uniref:Uncharacterized protein n=1 Tax=Tilletia horrida TaxID=155126 RepID=A0AAN6JR31_9BASI|nr:hypothetical protein OC846_004173 [Tilletia horrida]KAK0569613.1 hypothetical protein OC861_000793 [Tilletia horrida]